MASTAKKLKVNPLRPSDFGLIEHAVRRFNAVVSGELSKDDLEDVDLWVNCANKMEMGSEVRCIADDMSFVAFGICTFVEGSTAKLKIYSMNELDAVDYDKLSGEAGDYEAKLCGSKKWCIRKLSDGSVVKEGMATQLECLRELEDYKKALRA